MSSYQDRISIKIKELKETYSSYKLLITDPELYMWTFFDNLRNQIDLVVNQKLSKLQTENKEQNQAEITKSWEEIIIKIKQFEEECRFHINKLEPTFTKPKIYEHFKQKEETLFALCVKAELNRSDRIAPIIINEIQSNIDNIYYNGIIKKEPMLFMNKAVIFLTLQNNEVFKNMSEKTSFGKLVFITNKYIDQETIASLFQK